jgi:hypothetical protein
MAKGASSVLLVGLVASAMLLSLAAVQALPQHVRAQDGTTIHIFVYDMFEKAGVGADVASMVLLAASAALFSLGVLSLLDFRRALDLVVWAGLVAVTFLLPPLTRSLPPGYAVGDFAVATLGISASVVLLATFGRRHRNLTGLAGLALVAALGPYTALPVLLAYAGASIVKRRRPADVAVPLVAIVGATFMGLDGLGILRISQQVPGNPGAEWAASATVAWLASALLLVGRLFANRGFRAAFATENAALTLLSIASILLGAAGWVAGFGMRYDWILLGLISNLLVVARTTPDPAQTRTPGGRTVAAAILVLLLTGPLINAGQAEIRIGSGLEGGAPSALAQSGVFDWIARNPTALQVLASDRAVRDLAARGIAFAALPDSNASDRGLDALLADDPAKAREVLASTDVRSLLVDDELMRITGARLLAQPWLVPAYPRESALDVGDIDGDADGDGQVDRFVPLGWVNSTNTFVVPLEYGGQLELVLRVLFHPAGAQGPLVAWINGKYLGAWNVNDAARGYWQEIHLPIARGSVPHGLAKVQLENRDPANEILVDRLGFGSMRGARASPYVYLVGDAADSDPWTHPFDALNANILAADGADKKLAAAKLANRTRHGLSGADLRAPTAFKGVERDVFYATSEAPRTIDFGVDNYPLPGQEIGGPGYLALGWKGQPNTRLIAPLRNADGAPEFTIRAYFHPAGTIGPLVISVDGVQVGSLVAPDATSRGHWLQASFPLPSVLANQTAPVKAIVRNLDLANAAYVDWMGFGSKPAPDSSNLILFGVRPQGSTAAPDSEVFFGAPDAAAKLAVAKERHLSRIALNDEAMIEYSQAFDGLQAPAFTASAGAPAAWNFESEFVLLPKTGRDKSRFLGLGWDGQPRQHVVVPLANKALADHLEFRVYFFEAEGPLIVLADGRLVGELRSTASQRGQWVEMSLPLDAALAQSSKPVKLVLRNADPSSAIYLDWVSFGAPKFDPGARLEFDIAASPTTTPGPWEKILQTIFAANSASAKLAAADAAGAKELYLSPLEMRESNAFVGLEDARFRPGSDAPSGFYFNVTGHQLPNDPVQREPYYLSLGWLTAPRPRIVVPLANVEGSAKLSLSLYFHPAGTQGPVQVFIDGQQVGNITVANSAGRGAWTTFTLDVPPELRDVEPRKIVVSNRDPANKVYLRWIAYGTAPPRSSAPWLPFELV